MRSGWWVLLGLLACGCARAQTDWRQRLVGHPLYLRGAWIEPMLEFDEAGHPLQEAHSGALTLSGIDVELVEVHGSQMKIRGYRVALVANDNGMLERRNQTSVTGMFGTYQRRYISRDAVWITLHADAAGSFDAAVRAVFADGLVDLMDSVPAYWRCYAQAYFPGDLPQAEAEQQATKCARAQGSGVEAGVNGVSLPRLDTGPPVQLTRQASQMHLAGTSRVRYTVGAHGVPLRFQIVQALGAGVDEMLLQAISASHFLPAMKDGVAVAADMEDTVELTPGASRR